MAGRPSYRQLVEWLHSLEEICATYATDEDLFRNKAGEPYGSIPTEVRILALGARDRVEQRQERRHMLKSGSLIKATMTGAVRERCDGRTVVIHLVATTPDSAGLLATQPAICGSSPSRGWSDWLPAESRICPTCERKLARLRSLVLSA